MNWHLVALNGFIAPGEPCREDVLHDLTARALDSEEIDDFTHTRAMRATMTVTNHDDLRFEVICGHEDIDKAKQMLVRLINTETQARFDRHRRIAAFVEN